MTMYSKKAHFVYDFLFVISLMGLDVYRYLSMESMQTYWFLACGGLLLFNSLCAYEVLGRQIITFYTHLYFDIVLALFLLCLVWIDSIEGISAASIVIISILIITNAIVAKYKLHRDVRSR